MSATVLYMSMSLDGFIAGPNAGPDNGLGDGGRAPARVGADRRRRRTGERPRLAGGRQRPGRRRVHVHRGGRRRPGDLRAGRRLGRRPPRRRADLRPQPPRARHRRRRSGRSSPTSTTSTTAMAEAKRGRGRARTCSSTAPGSRSSRSPPASSTSSRSTSSRCCFGQGRRLFDDLDRRADRARAHPGPRGRGRRHPPALPRPALATPPGRAAVRAARPAWHPAESPCPVPSEESAMSSRPHPDTQIWPPHRAAMAVECPVCGAAPDEACERSTGSRASTSRGSTPPALPGPRARPTERPRAPRARAGEPARIAPGPAR